MPRPNGQYLAWVRPGRVAPGHIPPDGRDDSAKFVAPLTNSLCQGQTVPPPLKHIENRWGYTDR